MTYFYPNSQIAPNYNNAAGLVAWESIKPTGEPYLFPPAWYGFYDPGEEDIRGDGTSYFNGYASTQGIWTGTQGQLWYLQQTYTGSGWSGFVTCKLRLIDPSSYSTVNAVLRITKHSANKKLGQGWNNYKFLLTKIVVL